MSGHGPRVLRENKTHKGGRSMFGRIVHSVTAFMASAAVAISVDRFAHFSSATIRKSVFAGNIFWFGIVTYVLLRYVHRVEV